MFSDDKRGGTAPTPTPTHQGLFAHDESTRPPDPRRPASDLVDLNLALRAQFHRKKESSFVQPHISEAFDEVGGLPCPSTGLRECVQGRRRAARPVEQTLRDAEEDAQVRS